jgi:hypothetical protein
MRLFESTDRVARYRKSREKMTGIRVGLRTIPPRCTNEWFDWLTSQSASSTRNRLPRVGRPRHDPSFLEAVRRTAVDEGRAMHPMSRTALRVAALALISTAVSVPSGAAPEIRVLSNRPDLVSAGDVLIEVVLPPGTPPASVVLLRNGSPATAVSGVDVDGRYLA